MQALPPQLELLPGDHVTGIACVDCPGVLRVRREGARGFLRFECRIGHVYSLAELLLGKERRVEDQLWAAVLGFEELAALLGDLEVHAAAREPRGSEGAYQERRMRALGLAAVLRGLVQGDRPLREACADSPEGPAAEDP